MKSEVARIGEDAQSRGPVTGEHMKQLEGKIALVAGAGRNNGKAIALAFAREGADLVLLARERKAELDAVAHECEKLGAKVLPLLCDVSEHEQVERMVKQGLDHFGKHRRAHVRRGPARAPGFLGDQRRGVAQDVRGEPAFGVLSREGGRAVDDGAARAAASSRSAAWLRSRRSRSARTSSRRSTAFSASSRRSRYELGPYNVRANLIALMTIENVRANPEWYPEGGRAYNRRGARGDTDAARRQDAEVANVAVFLASDQSSYVTGDRILCAGGKYM